MHLIEFPLCLNSLGKDSYSFSLAKDISLVSECMTYYWKDAKLPYKVFFHRYVYISVLCSYVSIDKVKQGG